MNTQKETVKVKICDIQHMPILPCKDIFSRFNNEAEHLEHLTFNKAMYIYGDSIPVEVDDRLKFELEIIKKNDVARYFMLVHDIVNTAEKELGALVGPGCGSIARSLVAYCLGRTKIDPLKYDLMYVLSVQHQRCVHIFSLNWGQNKEIPQTSSRLSMG